MRVPKGLKLSIRIVLIILILLVNWIFVSLFLSSKTYEDLVFKNGGYIYSFLTIILIAIEGALRRKSIHKDIRRLPIQNEINITKNEEKRILIYSTLKTYYHFMVFGIFEVGLFVIVHSMTSKRIGELLFFGLVFLVVAPIVEIVRFLIIKSKQGYPKLKMNYRIHSDRIEIENEVTDKIIYFKDFESTVKYDNFFFIETKMDPKYLIIKGYDK